MEQPEIYLPVKIKMFFGNPETAQVEANEFLATLKDDPEDIAVDWGFDNIPLPDDKGEPITLVDPKGGGTLVQKIKITNYVSCAITVFYR